MSWTLFTPQQQRGAQLPNRPDPSTGSGGTKPGEAARNPAVDDAEWDRVVQPERQPQQGETELDGDERGDDAEQTPDPQAEQALRDASMDQDAEELDEAAREDRND